jgi:type II secretory pathway component PulC
MEKQKELAFSTSQRQPSIFYSKGRNETKPKINFAAFGVPDSNPVKPEVAVTPEESVGDMKNFKLVGTLPSVGAWIANAERVALLLKGDDLEGYKLDEINPGSAVFTREGKKYPIYLVYLTQGEKRPNTAQQGVLADSQIRTPKPQIPPASESGVVLAQANGDDGSISRELLNELLTNPLAEVGKMRLEPVDNGMMVRGMRSDSLFGKLGIKPKDVITSVNGIDIDDVSNVSNVISSMLSGERLDFQVEREGEPVKLGYAVR